MANKKIKSRFFGKIQQEYFEVYPHYNSIDKIWYKSPEIRKEKSTKERCLLSEIEIDHVFEKGDEIFIPDVNKNSTIEKVALGIDGSIAYYTTFVKEVLQGEKYEESKIQAEEKLKEELEKYNAWINNPGKNFSERIKKPGDYIIQNTKLYTDLKALGIYSTNEFKFMNLLTNSFVELEFEKDNSKNINIKEVGTARFIIPLRYENLMDKFLIKYKDKSYDFICRENNNNRSKIVTFYSTLSLFSKEKISKNFLKYTINFIIEK